MSTIVLCQKLIDLDNLYLAREITDAAYVSEAHHLIELLKKVMETT